MKKKTTGLTHHEELRLDYLSKNIHYLNEKEKRELTFLLDKKDAPGREWQVKRAKDVHQLDDQPLLPVYPSRKQRKQHQRETVPLSPYPRERKRPAKKKGSLKRLFLLLFCGLVLLLVGLFYHFYKGQASVAQQPTAEVFHGVESAQGVNILILGTDGRAGETPDQTRTDSIMVLHLNKKSKTLRLVSFMRDILIDSGNYTYKLNAAYTLGEQDNGQGAETIRQVLKETFGIDSQYYALVDFTTFASVVDTLFPEGVTIDARFSTVDGEEVTSVEVPDDLNMADGVVPSQTIHVGRQQMDGRTLLNYARFRKDDEGDFGRTRRQQEALSAILTQSKNPLKLFAGSEALGKVYAMTPTTIPQSFMWTDGFDFLQAAVKGMERTTVPELGDWVDEYDSHDGLGLRIDLVKYQEKLADLGLR